MSPGTFPVAVEDFSAASEWNQFRDASVSVLRENENIQLSIKTHTQGFFFSPWDQLLITVNLSQGPDLSQSTFSQTLPPPPPLSSAGSGESAASLPNPTKSFPVVSCREENDQG